MHFFHSFGYKAGWLAALIRGATILPMAVFDAEEIDRGEEYYKGDVPGDGYRYVRDARGVSAVIIGGEIAYQDGEYTESRQGVIVPGSA